QARGGPRVAAEGAYLPRGGRRRAARARRPRGRGLRDRARGRERGTRLRVALGRRPVHPLHGWHDRYAEGRDVAQRRRVLRRARLPGVLLVDGYGASETGGQGQSVVVSGGDIPSAPQFRVSADTMVLDDELRPAAPGVVGRIARRGPIPLGYYKDPEKSAATF